jgi:hypothetical protein
VERAVLPLRSARAEMPLLFGCELPQIAGTSCRVARDGRS